MKAYIEPYVPSMRDEVINMKLRESDEAEVLASSNMTPKEALATSLDDSTKAWVIKYNEEIICAFGVGILPADDTVGLVWLLGTQKIHDLKFRFIKYCTLVVDRMFFFDNIKCITNYVSTTHTEAIKWLKWMGFSFFDQEVTLVNPDVKFVQFAKWRNT